MARVSYLTVFLASMAAAAFAACSDDSKNDTGATEQDSGTPPQYVDGGVVCPELPRSLSKWEALPGLAIRIIGVSGGTGAGGNFSVGDTPSVTFTVTSRNGACNLPLHELDGVGGWLAGPTSNYQRVLPINTIEKKANTHYDMSAAVANADGSYTFKFPDPIPATYGPPLWDTPKFSDGELTDKPLLDGTYTFAVRAFRKYQAGKDEVVDPSTDVKDVLFGAAATIEPREVVTTANCNSCHTTLQRHSGVIRDTRVCVTCHTAGAEDGNSAATGDPTPVTMAFGVMIHKIHNGKHLPSVLGVATNPDGSRKYDAPPVRYVVGSGLRDFSKVGFPISPNNRVAMPRDTGYSTLTPAQQALDDETRKGATGCEKCHGDPDGAGPLPAPAQGDRAYTAPTRHQCGSCHDDVDWNLPYAANAQVQPPQKDDSACTSCHAVSGDSMAVKDSHIHPLKNPAIHPGLVFAIQSVAEGGTKNGNGKLDPGEKVVVSFTIKDDKNADVPTSELSGLSVVVSGPTTNRNLLLANTNVPLAALPAGPIYTTTLPEAVSLELVGTAATDEAVESFSTSRTPHWNVVGALTDVFERTATSGGTSTLLAAAGAGQNFVEVASTTGFARNDYVVFDDAVVGTKEFRQVIFVDGQRLWLNAPLRNAHASGGTAQEVTLTKKAPGTFGTTAATGTITEAAPASIAAGHDVIVSYTTDFVVPLVYPPPVNDSPDLDETSGEWAGKNLVPGTYTVGIWGSRSVVANAKWGADATTYKATSLAAMKDFLVGDAAAFTPYALVSSGESCNTCHDDLWFHGASRRGFDSCILCHGNAGAEDRPRYVAPNAPATPGVGIFFGEMAHKIHMGSNLADVANYRVAAHGAGAYPNNFTSYSYDGFLFPTKPNGAAECTKCHGKKNTAWMSPSDRNHPTEQTLPVRAWKAACGSCHDSKAAAAHIGLETHRGEESCAVCHGSGAEYDIAVAHKKW